MRVSVCVYLFSVHLSARTDLLLLRESRQTYGSLPWQCDLVLAKATSRHSSTLRMFNTKQCMQEFLAKTWTVKIEKVGRFLRHSLDVVASSAEH